MNINECCVVLLRTANETYLPFLTNFPFFLLLVLFFSIAFLFKSFKKLSILFIYFFQVFGVWASNVWKWLLKLLGLFSRPGIGAKALLDLLKWLVYVCVKIVLYLSSVISQNIAWYNTETRSLVLEIYM